MADIGKIISGVGGFFVGAAAVYSQGWVADHFKKKGETRKNVEKFMGKVTDVIAISTDAGYTNRQNRAETRTMSRAASQLERLGERKRAQDIRSYTNKWNEVYKMSTMTFAGHPIKGEKAMFEGEEERKLKLVKELDELTSRILDSRPPLLRMILGPEKLKR